MKMYVLDGSMIKDEESFYNEAHRPLCPNFDGFGRNLDAFNDVLRGGFLEYEYGEEFELVWRDSDMSKDALGPLFERIVEIIRSHDHVKFKLS